MNSQTTENKMSREEEAFYKAQYAQMVAAFNKKNSASVYLRKMVLRQSTQHYSY